jgi:hypothetical protein
MASIRHFLERRMRLKLNEKKSGIRQRHEVHFLGFRFQCREAAEGWQTAVLLSAKAERGLRTIVREMTPELGTIAQCMKELSRYLNGWVAHFRPCTEVTKAAALMLAPGHQLPAADVGQPGLRIPVVHLGRLCRPPNYADRFRNDARLSRNFRLSRGAIAPFARSTDSHRFSDVLERCVRSRPSSSRLNRDRNGSQAPWQDLVVQVSWALGNAGERQGAAQNQIDQMKGPATFTGC